LNQKFEVIFYNRVVAQWFITIFFPVITIYIVLCAVFNFLTHKFFRNLIVEIYYLTIIAENFFYPLLNTPFALS